MEQVQDVPAGAPQWMIWAIFIAAFVVAAVTLWKYVFKPLVLAAKATVAWYEQRNADHEDLSLLRNDVTQIRVMVLPDSGNSLFDKVKKLGDDVGDLAKGQEEMRIEITGKLTELSASQAAKRTKVMKVQ